MNFKWPAKIKENKYLRALAMSIVILIAITFVMDFSEFLSENSDKMITLGVNPTCNSSLAICSASIVKNGNFQRISFTIKKMGESKANEYIINLKAIGFDIEGIESISVIFEVMDKNIDSPITLLIPDKSENLVVPEKWNAETQLPLSMDKNLDWRAIIRLKSSVEEYRAEFPFTP